MMAGSCLTVKKHEVFVTQISKINGISTKSKKWLLKQTEIFVWKKTPALSTKPLLGRVS